MRRQLVTLTLAGLLGLLLTASDASACHKKKKCHCEPAPTPCVVVAPCPPPPPPCPPPSCEPPAKHCGKCGGPRHGLLGGLKCHKKAKVACAPAPCTQVVYATPVYGHATPAPQSLTPAPQGMPAIPAKAIPQG